MSDHISRALSSTTKKERVDKLRELKSGSPAKLKLEAKKEQPLYSTSSGMKLSDYHTAHEQQYIGTFPETDQVCDPQQVEQALMFARELEKTAKEKELLPEYDEYLIEKASLILKALGFSSLGSRLKISPYVTLLNKRIDKELHSSGGGRSSRFTKEQRLKLVLEYNKHLQNSHNQAEASKLAWELSGLEGKKPSLKTFKNWKTEFNL